MSLIELANVGIQKLQPYVPGKSEADIQRELGLTEVIKLASNENPLGPSEKVKQAVTSALSDAHRYPDGAAVLLRDQVAALHQKESIKAEQITFGNGSSEILDLALRVFVGEGDEVIFSDHAFALYPLLTQASGATARPIPALPVESPMPYGHDLAGFLSAITKKTRLIFIANPNNPTGTWLNKDALYKFIQQVPENIIIVLDEAYYDYATSLENDYPNASAWLNEFPNLIVTRTFSKAYGLASFRVGYGLSSIEIADLMNRIRPPFNVNAYGQAAAIAALADSDYMQKSIEQNKRGLQALQVACNKLGLSYLPSAANFITIDFGVDAEKINNALLLDGVIVRSNAGYNLPTTLRVSIGTDTENQRFIDAITQHRTLFGK